MLTFVLFAVLIIGAIVLATQAQQRAELRDTQRRQALRAITEAQEAAHALAVEAAAAKAEIQEAFDDWRESLADLPRPVPQTPAPKAARTPGPTPSALRRTPDRTRFGDYWVTPPNTTADDYTVSTRIKAVRELSHPVEICFSGWSDDEKARLETDAKSAGCTVRTNVTHHLTFLCVGAEPGWKKLEDAEAQGVALISGDQFARLICSVPEDDIPF